jgi:hypothetical protein
MLRYLEAQTREAVWIFDLVDAYLKRLHGPDSHPRPVMPLVFELTGRKVGGATMPLPGGYEQLVMIANASGYHLFFGREQLDDRSQRLLLLEDGVYSVRISGPGYQPVELDVTLPARDLDDPTSDPWKVFRIELEPASGYPFHHARRYRDDGGTPCGDGVPPAPAAATLLRGSLFHTDGRGWKGATVEIAGRSNTYTIGDDGQWVLWFAVGDDGITGRHTVTFTLPDATVSEAHNVCVVRGRETSLPATALRGWVLRNGVGVPGATIEVTGYAKTVTTREDGSWWYFFLPNELDQENVRVVSTLPDGESMLRMTRIRSRGTVVVPSFTFG